MNEEVVKKKNALGLINSILGLNICIGQIGSHYETINDRLFVREYIYR